MATVYRAEEEKSTLIVIWCDTPNTVGDARGNRIQHQHRETEIYFDCGLIQQQDEM